MSELEPNLSKSLNSVIQNVKFNKAYSKKKKTIPEPVQVQESNLDAKNEVTISNSALQVQIQFHVNDENLYLFITIRKGTRECKKRLLYPLVHFLVQSYRLNIFFYHHMEPS